VKGSALKVLLGDSCDFLKFSIAICLILSYTVGYFLFLGGFCALIGVKFGLMGFGLKIEE
jgi:hypothetical protein